MKAFQIKNEVYEIVETRGDFYYGKNNRGKLKVSAIAKTTVIDIDALPKAKVYRKPTHSSTPVVVDPIQTWKEIALTVNNKWNSNSLWQLAEDKFGHLDSKGDAFIESLLDSMFLKGYLNDAQAYNLAKFGVETGQLK